MFRWGKLKIKKSELNITVKDIQALGGLSIYSVQRLLTAAKKASSKDKKHWLSLKEFCEYVNIDYHLALNIFQAKC